MQSLYSIIQLLVVVFNPTFKGNYAVTVMAFMIGFGKFRMALYWMPIAIWLVFMSDNSYRTFEKLVKEHNISDLHTLAVKYNFHHGYIDMMKSYMKESFDNFWLYDYAHIINRIVPVIHVIAIVYMAVYIIRTSPYNKWLLEHRRWNRFITNYLKIQYSKSYVITLILAIFYHVVFEPVVYVKTTNTIFNVHRIIASCLSMMLSMMTSYIVSITIIRYYRELAIRHHLMQIN